MRVLAPVRHHARSSSCEQKELIIAATGPTDESETVPKVFNGVLGTKFKIIAGYPGSNEMTLSIERGETQGRCAFSWSSMKSVHRQWLDEKKITVLIQLSYNKHPELAHVPLASDLAKTEEERQIIKLFAARQVMGRPFYAPPDLPPDRAATLRKAFMDTLQGPGVPGGGGESAARDHAGDRRAGPGYRQRPLPHAEDRRAEGSGLVN